MSDVLRDLDGFDTRSLMEGAAVLALWPANADRHFAIETLIETLARASPVEGGRSITVADWKRWLASADSARLRAIQPDGLHDAPLVCEAVVSGRRRALLGGRLDFPALHYRLWSEALSGLPAEDCVRSLELLEAVGLCSDHLINGAAIGERRWPNHDAGGGIEVPSADDYEVLREALQTPTAIDGVDLSEALAPLIRNVARTDPWSALATTGGAPFLADPWRLGTAGLVLAADGAAGSGEAERLRRRLTSAALGVAKAAAADMDWVLESEGPDEFIARADHGCQVVVAVFVIPPGTGQPGEVDIEAPPSLAARHQALRARALEVGALHSLLVVLGDGRAITLDPDHPALHADSGSDPWLVALGELQAIGDALRGDPTALPAALEVISRPPWQPNYDLLDMIGLLRRSQVEPALREGLPEDGTELMLVLGRQATARHPAPSPRHDGVWVEVTRWREIADPALFCGEVGGFALLARSPSRFIWVITDGVLAAPHELAPVIATMACFWFARLCEAGWFEDVAMGNGELQAIFRIELDDRPGPALIAAPGKDAARVIAGPGFVHSLCRGDNDADRMLIAAGLGLTTAFATSGAPDLIETVAPPGRGTLVIWPAVDCLSNPPALEPPPLVSEADRRTVELGLAASFLDSGHIAVFQGEQLASPLDDLLAGLDRGIEERLAGCGPPALLDLVSLAERARHQSSSEAIGLPARAAIAEADSRLGVLESIGNRDLALRVLIERLSARPGGGQGPLGIREAALLRAAAELQLRLLGAREVFRYGAGAARLIVSPEFGILVDLDSDLPDAGQAMREQVAKAAPELMVAEHEEWWGERPELEDALDLTCPIALGDTAWETLDRAMGAEWRVGFEQLLRLLRALADLAEAEDGHVAAVKSSNLVGILETRTAIDRDIIRRALGRLTLGSCGDYEVSDPAHAPGGPNRERSYLRRPLVALGDGRLAFSSEHCLSSAKFLVGLIESNRLRGGRQVEKAVTRISQRLDRDFEEVVGEEVRRCGWQTLMRVRHLGATPLERGHGEEIGDIDVLAISGTREWVWLLDAKRLAPGLTPKAMARERQRVADHVRHHQERLEWVRSHRDALAAVVGRPRSGRWKIEAALVLDRPIGGALLPGLDMPIWTYWDLAGKLGDADSSPR